MICCSLLSIVENPGGFPADKRSIVAAAAAPGSDTLARSQVADPEVNVNKLARGILVSEHLVRGRWSEHCAEKDIKRGELR